MVNELLLNNNKMRYFKFGSGTKTMVMVPGLSIKSVCDYEANIIDDYKIFNDDFTVYCFDRVDNPKEGYTINDLANDLFEAITLLDLKDIYLFGASQGGMISFLLTLDHPNLIKKIVVASTTPCIGDRLNKDLFSWVDLAKKRKKEELYESFCKLIYPDAFYNKCADLISALAKDVTEEELDKFAILASAIYKYDIRDRLKEINTPVFMINDKTDKLFGIETINIVKSYINRDIFKYHIYDGFGHALYDFAPDFKQLMFNYFMGRE